MLKIHENNRLLPIRSTSRTIKRVVPFFKEQNIKTVLDYGAGTLRNSNYLLRNGFDVIIVDKKEQLAKSINMPEIKYIKSIFLDDDNKLLNLNIDAVISNFVFTLLSKEEQLNIMLNITKILNAKGFLLVEIKKSTIEGVNKGNYTDIQKEQNLLDNLIIPFGYNRIISYKNYYSLSSLYQKYQ